MNEEGAACFFWGERKVLKRAGTHEGRKKISFLGILQEGSSEAWGSIRSSSSQPQGSSTSKVCSLSFFSPIQKKSNAASHSLNPATKRSSISSQLPSFFIPATKLFQRLPSPFSQQRSRRSPSSISTSASHSPA